MFNQIENNLPATHSALINKTVAAQSSEQKQPFYSCDSWEEQAIKVGVQDEVLNPDGSLVEGLAKLKITDIEDISILAYAAATLETEVTPKSATSPYMIAEALISLRQHASDLQISNQLGNKFRFVGKDPISCLHPSFIQSQLEKGAAVKPEIMKLYTKEFVENVLERSGDVDGRIHSDMIWDSLLLFCRKYWADIGLKIPGLKHLPPTDRAVAVQKSYCDHYWNAGQKQTDGSKTGYIFTSIDNFDLVLANNCQNELFLESDLHIEVDIDSIHLKNGKVDLARLKARAVASSGNILIPICQKGLRLLSLQEFRKANAPALLTFLSDLSTTKTFRQKDLMQKVVTGFFDDQKVCNNFAETSSKLLAKRIEKKLDNSIYALLTIGLLFERHVVENWPQKPHPLHEDQNFALWTFWGKIVSYFDPNFQAPALTLAHIRTIWNVSPEFLQIPYAFSALFQLCCRPPRTRLPDAPECKLITFGDRPAVRLSNKATGHTVITAFEPEKWLTTLLDSKSERLPSKAWNALLQDSLILLPKIALEDKSVVEHHPELFEGLSDEKMLALCHELYARQEPYLDFGATVILMSAYLSGRNALLQTLLIHGIPSLLCKAPEIREAGLILLQKLVGSPQLPVEQNYHKFLFKYFRLLAATGNQEFCRIVANNLLTYPELASLPEFLEDTKAIIAMAETAVPLETLTLLVKLQDYFQKGDPTKLQFLKSIWKLSVSQPPVGPAHLLVANVPSIDDDLPELELVESEPQDRAESLLASCSGSKARLSIAETMELIAELSVDSPVRKQLAERLLQQSYSRRQYYFSEQIKPHLNTLVHVLLDSKSTATHLILDACSQASLKDLPSGASEHLIKLAAPLLSSKKRAVIGEAVRAIDHLIKEKPDLVTSPQVQAVVQKILANGLDKRHAEKWLARLQLPVNGKAGAIWHHCKVLLRPANQSSSVVNALYSMVELLVQKDHKPDTKDIVRLLAQENFEYATRTQFLAKIAHTYTPQEQFNIRMGLIERDMGNRTIDLVDQAEQIIALKQSSVAIHCNEQNQQILFTLLLSILSLPPTVSRIQCALALSKYVNINQAKYERKELIFEHLQTCGEALKKMENSEAQAELAKFDILGKKSRAFRCELYRDLMQTAMRNHESIKAGKFAVEFLKASPETAYPEIVSNIVWDLIGAQNPENNALVQSLLSRMCRFPKSLERTLAAFRGTLIQGGFTPRQKADTLSAYLKLVPKADQAFLTTLSAVLPLENVQGLETVWDKIDRQLCLDHPQLVDQVLARLTSSRTEWTQERAYLVFSTAVNNWPSSKLKSVLLRDEVQTHLLQADLLSDCIATHDMYWEPFYLKRLACKESISEKDQGLWLNLGQEYCKSPEGTQMAWLIASRVYSQVANKEPWQLVLQQIHQYGNTDTVQALAVRSTEWGLQLEAPSLKGITANQMVTVREIKEILVSKQQNMSAVEWQQLFNRAQELPADASLMTDLLDYWDAQSQRQGPGVKYFLQNIEVAFAAVYNAFHHKVNKQQTKYCVDYSLLGMLLSSEKIDKEKRLRLLAMVVPVAIKGSYADALKYLGKKLLAIDPKAAGELFKYAKASLTKGLKKGSLPLLDAVCSWLDFENKKPLAKRVGNCLLRLDLAKLPVQEGYDGTGVARLVGFMAEENDVEPYLQHLFAWLFRQEIKQPAVKAKALVNLIAKSTHQDSRAKIQPCIQHIRDALLGYSKNAETFDLVLQALKKGKLNNVLDGGEIVLWSNCVAQNCQKLAVPGISKQARLDMLKFLEELVIKYPAEVAHFADLMSSMFYALLVDNRDIPTVRQSFHDISHRIMKERKETKLNFAQTACKMAVALLLKLIPKVNDELLRLYKRKEYAFHLQLRQQAISLVRTVFRMEDVLALSFREQVPAFKRMIEDILFLPFVDIKADDLLNAYADAEHLHAACAKSEFIYRNDQKRLHAMHLVTSRCHAASKIPQEFFKGAMEYLQELFTKTYAEAWGAEIWDIYKKSILDMRGEKGGR